MHARRRSCGSRTPPPFHNKGNLVFSLSQLGRHWPSGPRSWARWCCPRPTPRGCWCADGAVRGVQDRRQGARPRRASRWAFEPGVEVHAQATVLCEGTQGHLAGAAIEHFGLQRPVPAGSSLGVKEVWRVAKPLDRVDPHAGLAVPDDAARIARSAAASSTRWAPDMVAIGLVLGLDYRDASLSVHDSLQQFKTHPLVRGSCWRAASASAGARRRSPRAGSWRCRRASRCRARC